MVHIAPMMSTSPSVRVQITPGYINLSNDGGAHAAALLLPQRDVGTLTSGCACLSCRPATQDAGTPTSGCAEDAAGVDVERPRHFPTRIVIGYHRRGVVAQGAASPCASDRRSDHGVPCPDGAYNADIHVAAYSRPVLQTPVTTGHHGLLT
jgi:hypothetical protein